jgi:O-antigen/teichoic acid export membrane protein
MKEKKDSNSNTIQAFWVMAGSLSAFGFAIVSSMLLSRYFDKHDYGTYKQVMYVYSSLLVVFTLGLPKAFSFFLPKVTKGQAKDLISKINIVLMALGAIMSLILFLGAGLIADLLKNQDLAQPILYFSLVPLFMLPTMGLEGILATYRQTFFLAIYKTLTQIFMLLCVVIPVIFFKGDVDSAIIGFTVASFFCFLAALYFKNKPVKEFPKEKNPYSYRDIFNYSIPIMGASIWGIIISSSDQFFISRYFGNEVFADFANGSLELPFVGMIISSTSIVLAPVFAKQVHNNNPDVKEEILALWKSVLTKTVKLIYPLVVFCFCFSDVIMVLLYGEQYHSSGIYFQLKVVVNFFTVMAYASLMLSIGAQKYYFKVHMLGAIILVLLEWLIASQFDSPYLVTVISVVCQIGRIIAMLLFISHFFKIRLIDLFPMKLVLNIVIPSFFILYTLKYFLLYYIKSDEVIVIIVSFIIYILLYGVWAYYKNIDYISIIKPLIIKIKK